jgi:hypothetical protein
MSVDAGGSSSTSTKEMGMGFLVIQETNRRDSFGFFTARQWIFSR